MTDVMQRLRDANPIPDTPAAPAIGPLLARLEAAPKRKPRRTRRGALVAFATLIIAVPALAATQPWQPILGDPSGDNAPAGVSNSPPPAEQRALLEVLRRPQQEADRGPIAQELLHEVGAEYKGVRLSSVRLLTSADGHHALLVPSEEHGQSPEPGRYEVKDDLCLQHGTGVGSGSFCGTAEQIRSGGFLGASAEISDGRVRQYDFLGVVPNGVAKVVLTFPRGERLSSDVRDNFFWVPAVPVEERTVRANQSRGSAPSLPSKKLVPATPDIRWYDAAGEAVGPPARVGR
jgi:hypothetical protein